jgi:hypothetical protein
MNKILIKFIHEADLYILICLEYVQNIIDWIGDGEQIDDITLMGIRI